MARRSAAEAAELRRKRVRALLELLVLAGPLRRDRIGDLMWPDLDPLRRRAQRSCDAVPAARRARAGSRRSDARSWSLRIDNDVVALAHPPHVEVDLWQFRDDVAAADEADRRGDRVATIATSSGRAAAGAASRSSTSTTTSWPAPSRRCATPSPTPPCVSVSCCSSPAASTTRRCGPSGSRRESPYDERAYRLAIAAHIQRRDRHAIAHAVAATRAMLDDLGVDPEAPTQMLLRQAEDHIGRAPALAV